MEVIGDHDHIKTILLEWKSQKTGCKNILETLGREELQTVSVENVFQEFPFKREVEKLWVAGSRYRVKRVFFFLT